MREATHEDELEGRAFAARVTDALKPLLNSAVPASSCASSPQWKSHLPRPPEQVAPEPCEFSDGDPCALTVRTVAGWDVGEDAAKFGGEGHAETSPTGRRSCFDKSKNALPL